MNKPFLVIFISLFPDFFTLFTKHSIIKKAIEKKIVEFKTINLREFGVDKLKKVDDYQYGPGRGMVLRPEPIYDAILHAEKMITGKACKVLLSAMGKKFDQSQAWHLASEYNGLILISGNYEGFDERVLDYIDYELSIGDYVLTGGEIPALAVANATVRMLKGVINPDSLQNESFIKKILDYPVYTKPKIFKGKKVPEILFTGHHENIKQWREKQALNKTKKNNPDLLKNIQKK